jgi:hypothetical protein
MRMTSRAGMVVSALALAVALTGAMAGASRAEDRHDDRGRDRHDRDWRGRDDHPYGYAPPPVVYAPAVQAPVLSFNLNFR